MTHDTHKQFGGMLLLLVSMSSQCCNMCWDSTASYTRMLPALPCRILEERCVKVKATNLHHPLVFGQQTVA